MLERIWKARRDERGFTLIELIMVLVILGILLALALPAYLGTRRKAYLSEADQHLQEMRTQAWLFYVEKNTFSGFTGSVPTSPNWTYGYGTCDATTCVMSATNANLLGSAASVTLTLSSNGAATVTSSGF
ncbi:MAG: prepilin-type N-terminal cleavage/methylation domain-containing protein [Armatimonadota bacterium]|nr:prepilin-type N-terminal cleavage/methylation domain-containing protein [Armatimonadota bacterium]